MANKTVKLFIRIRTADGKRPYVKPVFLKGTKLKALFAIVNGEPEHHPEGCYYLRYALGPKRIWERLTNQPDAAIAALLRKKAELLSGTATAPASNRATQEQDSQDVSTQDNARLTLADAVRLFLLEVELNKSPKTAQGYRYDLGLFQQSCAKTFLSEIGPDDMKDFIAFLRKRNLSDRTICNMLGSAQKFLRDHGIKGLPMRDWPRYTEKEVSAYNEDELKALFSVTTDDQRLAYQFFLYSGGRDAEVMFASWRDIDFKNRTFTVREKLDLGFRPKDRQERTIPLPDKLIELLRARRRQYPDARLIFTNSKGKPEGHFLRNLKYIALRGGLNCGHCVNKTGLSCKTHPVCDNWELHKFRKTMATMHHERGVSARTLQDWLGHSDLETTIRYLKVADLRSDRTRDAVNKTFAAIA